MSNELRSTRGARLRGHRAFIGDRDGFHQDGLGFRQVLLLLGREVLAAGPTRLIRETDPQAEQGHEG